MNAEISKVKDICGWRIVLLNGIQIGKVARRQAFRSRYEWHFQQEGRGLARFGSLKDLQAFISGVSP